MQVRLRHALTGVWTAALLCLAVGSLAGGIYLRTGTIDTDAPEVAAMATQPSLGAGYYLLQLKGPV